MQGLSFAGGEAGGMMGEPGLLMGHCASGAAMHMRADVRARGQNTQVYVADGDTFVRLHQVIHHLVESAKIVV